MSSYEEISKHALPSPARTQGDGMETTDNAQNKLERLVVSPAPSQGRSSVDSFLLRQDTARAAGGAPLFPGTVVNLNPKCFTQAKKKNLSFAGFKSKEPKFVPYEPYKAAVNPIVPMRMHSRAKRKVHRNVLKPDDTKAEDSSVQSCVEVDQSTLGPESVDSKESTKEKDEEDLPIPKSWSAEKQGLEAEMKRLKDENGQLELQLKFQAQVNAELKKLLVAAVGEDLQLRVNHLTEDKLQLAHALLNSAKSLSTHQEQTEWLAGQCEVWRSKFLASSLMVEELARWKAALSQKAVDLQNCVRNILYERTDIQNILVSIYRELRILRDNFDSVTTVTGSKNDSRDVSSLNIKDLASAIQQMSEVLTLQLLGSAKERRPRNRPIERHLTNALTPAEKMAEELLQQPVAQLLAGGPDAACSAVMGAAVAVAGKRLFPEISNNVTACCAHCSGEVKQL